MSYSNPTRFLAMLLSALLLMGGSASAQVADFQGSLSRTATFLKGRQWEQALNSANEAIGQLGGTAQLYGPQFGHLYYFKGFAELRLRQYEAAANSFKTCYEKYPSKRDGVDGAIDANGTNIYHKKAILRWAESLQGNQQFDEAVKTYKLFLEERDPQADDFPEGSFLINISICYFRSEEPDFSSGIDNLRKAIDGRRKLRVSEDQIMRSFRALTEATIRIGPEAEQTYLDFLAKNDPDVTLAPYKAFSFSPIYMQMANNALQASLYRTSLSLYARVPSAKVALDDVDATIASIRPRLQVRTVDGVLNLQELNKIRGEIESQLAAEDPTESIALRAIAAISMRMQNERNAFAAYKQIEELYNQSKNREDSLYRLVMLGAALFETEDVERYGQLFLRTFPESESAPVVRRQLLLSIFQDGDYAKCIEIANRMIPTLDKNTDQHDTALYVLGGSLYYEARFNEAQPVLDEHARTYPESKYRLNGDFFQASNVVRLQDWGKAGTLLDAFLEKYPDPKKNGYLPNALYDRANVHFAEEELDQALVHLDRLEKEFPDVGVISVAYNLKGNILQTQEKAEEAEKYYKLAFEIAERRRESFVAGEALSYIVGLLSTQDGKGDTPNRLKDLIPYYEAFFSDYAEDSPYGALVAVSGLPAMREAGRTEEGLDALRAVIIDLAQDTSAPGLEPAINSYSEAYLDDHTPEQLREHFYNDFTLPTDSARALLRTALIAVEEQSLAKAQKENDEDAVLRSQASIKVLFRNLKEDFDPKALTNFTLIKLGDFIREKTESPLEAAVYYREILSRDNPAFRFEAYFGLADVLATGGSAEQMTEAIGYLDQVIANADKAADKERALYRATQIYSSQEKWDDVIRVGKEYLTPDEQGGDATRRGTRRFTKFASRVTLLVAQAFDAKGDFPNALVTYSNAFTQGSGLIPVAVPAYIRWIEIIWDGKVSGAADKQSGYDVVEQYTRLQGNNYERMQPQDQKLFDTLRAKVAELEASGQIKTYAQQQEEADQ